MELNPLKKLASYGQSVWLDTIRRDLITSGRLRRLIDESGVRGITTNPAIFEKAIDSSRDYDRDIRVLALSGKEPQAIYEALVLQDVRSAAEAFRPLYEATGGRDGFVSIEVDPRLAHDTAGTLAEARRLWDRLSLPNLFIKVPATSEGVPAIRQLIGDGINVNITLLFSLARYRQVAEAYLAGLEDRLGRGASLDRVASVASFFLSRIDTLVDPRLECIAAGNGPLAVTARKALGEVAIAMAREAYRIYGELFGGDRFDRLRARGAAVQRLLWASTSTKNPAYSDVKYVEALIGPDTVNTLPLETIEAYRDHGKPRPRLAQGVRETAALLKRLPKLGVDLDAVARQLEADGVEKFVSPLEKVLKSIEERAGAAEREPVDPQWFHLGSCHAGWEALLSGELGKSFAPRLWRKDASLWKQDPLIQAGIRQGLGWLRVAEEMAAKVDGLLAFAREVKSAGYRQVLHMGMGGSSLAPLAFAQIFPPAPGYPRLAVLDTTSPAALERIAGEMPLGETLFIVASKSGTTAEPMAFHDTFYARLQACKGERAGDHFVAITDPGTPLAAAAEKQGFRRIFFNAPDIGGRYSALSYFGLVPAALMGIDVGELLVRALRMARACAPGVPARDNPGVQLGFALGELSLRGREKMTLLTPPPIAALGMWLEQLLAESTGKEDRGVLPVDGEPLGPPDAYRDDRLFVHFSIAGQTDPLPAERLAALEAAGQPLIHIQLGDPLDLGQEFFRWEVATAAAGAVLGINPFDQPNVQESKQNTDRLLGTVRRYGRLPAEAPPLAEGPLRMYGSGPGESLIEALVIFLGQAMPRDYLCLQAYWPQTPESDRVLQAIRLRLRDRLHLATTVGYGPRFLHSTGQYHKGGPNTGLFIQLTTAARQEIPIPGAPYGFGVFIEAQARGDREALLGHGRRVVCIRLTDWEKGLPALEAAVKKALEAPCP